MNEIALKRYLKPAAWMTIVSAALLALAILGLMTGIMLQKRDYTAEAQPFMPLVSEKRSYAYIDVCGVSDWIYRYEHDTGSETYYAAEDGEGYFYAVQLYQWQHREMAAQQLFWNRADSGAEAPAPYRLYGLVYGAGTSLRESFSEVFGISADDYDRYFGSMYLDATNTPGKEAGWLWYTAALFGFLFSMLFLILVLPASANQRRCLKRLQELGELERAASAFEASAAEIAGKDRARATEDYLFGRGTGIAVRWDDIVWAYARAVANNSFSLVICTTAIKNVQAINFGAGADLCGRILALIAERNPRALIGYTPENIAQYKALRKAAKAEANRT